MCDKNKKDYWCLYFKAPGPGPGPQFVFTDPGPHLVFTPNLYLPAQPDA